MRAFINKTGELNILNCDHFVYCQNILKKPMRTHLKNNVRILQYGDHLAVETKQKKLTASQLKMIRKIYRQEQCFIFVAEINKKCIFDIKKLSLN